MAQGRALDYIGPILRRKRELAEVSQADLAARAGLSASTVSRLENAIAWPQDMHIDGLLDVYEVETGLDRLEVAEEAVAAWREAQGVHSR